MEPEPRVCIIMNRFTRNLSVMYASSACELVFRVDPDQMVGLSFLLFIRADDLSSFVGQMDVVRSTSAIVHMRFWFQSPNWPREIPCEAMLCGAADGMVAVVRRCKPFVRRHLIAGSEHLSTNGLPTPPSTIPTLSSLPELSGRPLTRSRLDRIKVVELDDNDMIRPLTDIADDDPRLAQNVSSLPDGYQIRENYIQEYQDDDNENDDDENDADNNNINNNADDKNMDVDLDLELDLERNLNLSGQSCKTKKTIGHGVSYRECF